MLAWIQQLKVTLDPFCTLCIITVLVFMLNGDWVYDPASPLWDTLEPLTQPVTPVNLSSGLPTPSYQPDTSLEGLFHDSSFNFDPTLLDNVENSGFMGSAGHSMGTATGSAPHSPVLSPAHSVSSLASSNVQFMSPYTAPSQPPPPPSQNLNPNELSWDRDPTRGTLRVKCPKCGRWIGTGSNQRTTGPLVNHMRSIARCRVRSQLDLEFGRATAARLASFPFSTDGPSQRLVRSQSAPPVSPIEVKFDVTTPSKFRYRKYAHLHE